MIVIENKIRSGINGANTDDYSQLNKYYEYTRDYTSEHNKKLHCFMFVPDYNYGRIDLTAYGMDGIYTVIPYSAIHGFFVRNVSRYIDDRHFPDFLRGLERHTMTMSELNFKTMRQRFLRKIAQAK